MLHWHCVCGICIWIADQLRVFPYKSHRDLSLPPTPSLFLSPHLYLFFSVCFRICIRREMLLFAFWMMLLLFYREWLLATIIICAAHLCVFGQWTAEVSSWTCNMVFFNACVQIQLKQWKQNFLWIFEHVWWWWWWRWSENRAAIFTHLYDATTMFIIL